MIRSTLLFTAALTALPLASAYAQEAGEVTIVLGEDLDLVEPCMATRSNIGRVIMQNVNETLTQYDVKGGKGVLPRLAESWEDQGNGTWRFNLRQGVKFSDGTAFDANDVKHSFERTMSDKLTCETPRYFGDTKLSLQRRRRHTRSTSPPTPPQPILPLLMSLVTIVPSETPIEFVRDPVGTGPYKLTEWNPGQNIVARAPRRLLGRGAGGREGDLRLPHRPGRCRRDGGEGRGRPRAVDLGRRRDQPGDRRLLPELRDPLPAHRQRRRADQRHARARGAEPRHRPRCLHRHRSCPKGPVEAAAMVPPTTLGWNPDVKPFPYDPGARRRRCSPQPRPTACRSTPSST